MASDPFRIVMVAIFSVILVTTAYHRIQAARAGERISRKDEGRVLFLSIRLAGAVTLGGIILYLFDSGRMAWASAPLPDAVRWLGAVVGLCAIVLLYATLRNLGPNLTDTVMIRAKHTLVTVGPYRWVRHPFYVSILLVLAAAALLSANWFIALSGLAVFSLLAFRCSIEERKLTERFGDEYRVYMQKTGRFIPRW